MTRLEGMHKRMRRRRRKTTRRTAMCRSRTQEIWCVVLLFAFDIALLQPFTQAVPERSDFERAHNPPTLPPHLLQVNSYNLFIRLINSSFQVILNKDTPVQCDPNVLPEPNHVMLNHLYALSIKDGVMVLSATHRYKKKYVTTLLYKPI